MPTNKKQIKVVIDPGHGGSDSGAVAWNGKLEKNINLMISLYQYKRFTELGFDTMITRDKDTYIELNTRGVLVRDTEADICICNHNNAFNGNAKRTEIIYGKDTNLLNIVKILEARFEIEFSQPTKIYKKLNSSNEDYYAMHRITGKVDTILFEYGFIDNADDYNFVMNNYMDMSEAIIEEVCKEYGVEYVSPVIEKEIPVEKKVAGLTEYEINLIVDEICSRIESLSKKQKVEPWMQDVMDKGFNVGLITSEDHDATEYATKWFTVAVGLNLIDVIKDFINDKVKSFSGFFKKR